MTPHSKNQKTLVPKPFREGWAMVDTQALVATHLAAPSSMGGGTRDFQAENDWRQRYQEHLDKAALAIGQHLVHLSEQGQLQPPPHTEFVNIRFLNALRQAASGQPVDENDGEALGSIFQTAIRRLLVAQDTSPENPGDKVEGIHRQIVGLIEKGTFHSFELEMEPCRNSGTRLAMEIRDWKIQALRLNPDALKFDPLEAGDIRAPRLMHLPLPAPSGTLLITDRFAHPGFEQLVDEALEGLPSINSTLGKQECTQKLLEQLGVGRVFVGNTCPEIISDEEGIKVGCVTEDSRATTSGYVCTDLWWATAVDKQVLIDLIAQDIPAEQAAREVEALIENQASPITALKVKPGTHHLYCAGDYELFPALFDRDGVTLDSLREPMLLISPTELPPRPSRRGPRIG